MTIEELTAKIPAVSEYSLTIQRLGYRYYCYLRINNGSDAVKFNGTSNELGTALGLIAEKLDAINDGGKTG